jgi:hypothetical protein
MGGRPSHLKVTRDAQANVQPQLIEFIEPLLDESARLVSQGGLFTRAPLGQTIEPWLRSVLAPGASGVVLTKLLVPNRGRDECLRALNAMNINRKSLFPDLSGASTFCNMELQIDSY